MRGFLEASKLEELNISSATHVCISAAEGFGFTAAQAEARSAAMILNSLPVYQEYYGSKEYVGFLETPCVKDSKNHVGFLADFSSVTTENIKSALRQTIPSGQAQVDVADARLLHFNEQVAGLVREALACFTTEDKPIQGLPPILKQADCPPISDL
jgi:hypothetical protein